MSKPYDVEHDLETFLAMYRTLYAVGYYASQRYFKNFETIGYFTVNGKTFTINRDIMYNYYSVEFPEESEQA